MSEECFKPKFELQRIILVELFAATHQWCCFATPLTKINLVNFTPTHSSLKLDICVFLYLCKPFIAVSIKNTKKHLIFFL